MKVELSSLAESDLVDIAQYIAADNPDRDFNYVDELLEACPVLPGFEEGPFRRRVRGRHAIIYAVVHERVRVLRILSTAMGLDPALGSGT